MNAPDVLLKIADYKAREVEDLRDEISIEDLRLVAGDQPPARGFAKALREASAPAIIAEVKKASPSKGLIRADFEPVAIANAYEEGGATCLSVLTDGPGFMGSNAIFAQVRAATTLPLLRKDFMLDPIQIVESRAMGADCVLIIMAMIDDDTAKTLMEEAAALGMDALVETHDAAEIDRAIAIGATLIGINNRDLRTFETSLDTFGAHSDRLPDTALRVAESGIYTRDDIDTLAAQGAQAYLVGESLMRQEDVVGALRDLKSSG
jgi:indole-3-glycerol phosphate synthase